MARTKRPIVIDKLPTGVPNLDEILGGGIPELSVTVIAGNAGTGKTTLAQQIAFHNARVERPALVFTTLGEPTVKVLRYQQQFAYFDPELVGSAVFFIDLGSTLVTKGPAAALAAISAHVERLSPRIVIIDSYRTISDLTIDSPAARRAFTHDLAVNMATWNGTAILVGEYQDVDVGIGPEFTVADNVLLLSQELQQNSVVRRLRVVKMRGQAPQPGRHAFRISDDGVRAFPRLPVIDTAGRAHPRGPRAGFGIAGLDDMMRGGIPRGQTCILAGASGTGKTLLGLHFAVTGAAAGEPCVMVTFEESPAEHAEKMASFGWNLSAFEKRKTIDMVYLRPVDLSIDEVIATIGEAVLRVGAKRVVLNSVSGLEIALPQTERQELREGLYRLTANLTARGLVVVLTTEVPDILGERISVEGLSFIADNVVLLKYVEIAGELRRAVGVIKMRTSAHDNTLREYRIGPKGIEITQSYKEYSGILTGIPTLRTLLEPRPYTAGLAPDEEAAMHTLLALKRATVDELALSLGNDVDKTQQLLDRLVDTGYVMPSTAAGRQVYRIALITPSTGTERKKR